MRFSAFLLLGAAAGLAALTAAAAQDAPPPAEPPAEAVKAEPAKAEPGLSDLSETVEGLQDAPASTETPAETPPAQPAPPDGAAIPPELYDGGVRIAPPAVSNAVPVDASGQPIAEPAETPPSTPPEAPAGAAAPAPAPAPAGPRFVEPLTRAQLDALAAASARGRLLSAIAGAGQIATRDMLGRVSDPEGAGIAGWIAEPEGNGITVTFYAEPQGDAAPATVFRANILGGRVVSRDVFIAPEGRPALNRVQARMATARRTAAAQDHRPCGGDQFNYFVIPPAGTEAPIDVYQFSPQTARGRYPLGGHFKTIVAADGSVAETRGYTNACVDLEAPEVPAGQRPAPLGITHLLDPLPTEIHAFLSIWTQRPLVVVAGDPQRFFGVTAEGMGELPRENVAR
jgi:hypothetical protein